MATRKQIQDLRQNDTPCGSATDQFIFGTPENRKSKQQARKTERKLAQNQSAKLQAMVSIKRAVSDDLRVTKS